METWEQMLPPQDSESGELVGDLLHEQYDLIYGSWPQNYDEVMLIVNKDNEISDLVIYSLGLSAQDEVVESMQHMLDGSEFDSKDIQSWSYEDLCNMSFKIVCPLSATSTIPQAAHIPTSARRIRGSTSSITPTMSARA